MSASQALRLASRQRAALIRESLEVVGTLIPAYRSVIDSLVADHAGLTRLIRDAEAAGTVVDSAWLERDARFTLLANRYGERLASLDTFLASAVTAVQASAANNAALDSAALIRAVGFTATDPVAFTARTFTSAQSASWMARLAPSKVKTAKRIILDGVARGRAPAVTARLLSTHAETSISHALTVVRTEQLRAYREVTREAYVENPAVEGWRWSSRRSPRTCETCWELDGEVFPLDEVMDTHPRCMCSMLPVVAGIDYGAKGREVRDEVMTDA